VPLTSADSWSQNGGIEPANGLWNGPGSRARVKGPGQVGDGLVPGRPGVSRRMPGKGGKTTRPRIGARLWSCSSVSLAKDEGVAVREECFMAVNVSPLTINSGCPIGTNQHVYI
jgi:hypothetical protein